MYRCRTKRPSYRDGSGAVPTGMLAASLFFAIECRPKAPGCLEHDGAGVLAAISVLDFVKFRYRMSLCFRFSSGRLPMYRRDMVVFVR